MATASRTNCSIGLMMDFLPAIHPPEDANQPALWFIFEKYKLLVRREKDACTIPEAGQAAESGITPIRKIFLGCLGHRRCYAAALNPENPVPPHYHWMDLRELPRIIGEEMFWLAGRANHLLDWDLCHRFCGRCGRPFMDKPDERAKICSTCGLINYPRLSPAVIMAVLKEGRILLARNKRFRAPFYSVLAGFVEPGETLEECVRREIREEVGLTVENIRYFGSQPWPFPNSLMVGFVADHAGGEIRVDNIELMEAGWFTARNLPRIPPRISIARRLIDWYVDSHSVNHQS